VENRSFRKEKPTPASASFSVTSSASARSFQTRIDVTHGTKSG
jgi:hypothetical protein